MSNSLKERLKRAAMQYSAKQKNKDVDRFYFTSLRLLFNKVYEELSKYCIENNLDIKINKGNEEHLMELRYDSGEFVIIQNYRLNNLNYILNDKTQEKISLNINFINIDNDICEKIIESFINSLLRG